MRILLTRLVLLAVASRLLLHAANDQDPSPDPPEQNEEGSGINWGAVIGEAMLFDGIQHGFRIATQDYTQDRLSGKFFEDWSRSIENLHGWSDGNYFLTNYVLHPMQGAVNGYIFVQNDPRYKEAVFGRNREYWKSRARAALFAFVASEELELGPFSEASLGNTQQYYPQWGLVDDVITPTVGLVWMIGEDFLDRYLVTRIEMHTRSVWARALARSALNPSRSMANLMALRAPWYRDTRSNRLSDALLDPPSRPLVAQSSSAPSPHTAVPNFELVPVFTYTQLDAGHAGSLDCVGGGANAIFNVNRWFGAVADVDGCKMLSPGINITGDSLTYVAGPRFYLSKPQRLGSIRSNPFGRR